MPRSVGRWRFDVVEFALAAVLIAVVGFWIGTRYVVRNLPEHPPEAESLVRAYGPDRNSQYEEEWIVRDFFKDRRGGFFVDIGANHYKHFNNTYFLEKQLDWSGIAIEPLREFEADYRVHRPRTRFRPFFVSDRSNEQAKLYVLKQLPLVTSAEKTFTQRFGQGATEVAAPTITLNDLF